MRNETCMKNIVIAAGYATRLGELTRNFPKPLLKIGEKSILGRMLDDIDKIPEIDRMLNDTARGWKTDRFASCDLAILRLACYFLSAVKFHRFASEHSLLNKLTSILIFPAPFFMRLNFFVWYAVLVCLVSCCAAIQELGIHLRRPVSEAEREEE